MSISLARAFTARRAKQNVFATESSASSRFSLGSKDGKDLGLRAKISGPLHLVHTTNMLSYNAPDIPSSAGTSKLPGSSSPSLTSDDESDGSRTAATSPPTSPDVAPDESCSSPDPEANHLSTLFIAPDSVLQFANMPALATPSEPPVIPRRALSHTKKTSFEAIARSRSASRVSRETASTKASLAPSSPRASSTSSTASSAPSINLASSSRHMGYIKGSLAQTYTLGEPADHVSHPFGHELAQVTEIAEEYGVKERLTVIDAEEKEMQKRGLAKVGADVYIAEIDALFARFFPEIHHFPNAPTALWI